MNNAVSARSENPRFSPMEAEGTVEILPARNGRHGIVRVDGIHLVYEDG